MFITLSYLFVNNFGNHIGISSINGRNCIRLGLALDIIASLTMMLCACAAAYGYLSINATGAAIMGTIGIAHLGGTLKVAYDLGIFRKCSKSLNADFLG